MSSERQEPFLSRWSRRKSLDELSRQEEDDLLAKSLPAEPDTLIETPAPSTAAEPEPVLTDADMPPLETLHAESDFSLFMSSGVSDALRNQALKKLFAAPVFNIRDGLDEYDDDFTSFEKLGDIITCDMKHQVEMEARKLERELQSLDQEVQADTAVADDPDAADAQHQALTGQAPETTPDPMPDAGEVTQTEEESDDPKP